MREWLARWRADFSASLVVVLVAIPLSLGIALASGAPVAAGLISAAVGGIIAAALGGSAVAVAGPAAGLTVIVAQIVTTFGWRGACAITAAAGLLQLIFGVSRIARTALAVSPAVMHGILAGVGIVIALSQIHIVLGDSPQSSALANLAALPRELMRHHTQAVVTGLITLAILALWPRTKANAFIPAPLAALALATVTTTLTGWTVATVDLPDKLLDLTPPAWPQGRPSQIILAVAAIAVVASVESLLCVVAVDRLHSGPRANLDRELIGQGVANVAAGLLGALPVASVIVRSRTNVAAGARSRASAILHGVWIILLTGVALPLIELIPLPALAALLVYTGISMVNLAHARALHRHKEMPIYLLTALTVVVWGLLEAVAVGMVCAGVWAIWRLTRTRIHAHAHDGEWHISVEGCLTFVSVPRLCRVLSKVAPGSAATVELNTSYMDHAAITALHDWESAHRRAGGTVHIDELHHPWYQESLAGQTQRTRPPRHTPWWLPHRTHASTRHRLTAGARLFHRYTKPRIAPLLAKLAHNGQRPGQLFITCADSRVLPSLITATGPGELFTVRNVGAVVPPPDQPDAALTAGIDFALQVLQVDTITVCGHSHCCALEAAARPDAAHPEGLRAWLGQLQASLRRAPSTGDGDALAQAHVRQQLEHLQSYPQVSELVHRGRLELVGMYFDLAHSRVYLLNPHTDRFEPAGSAGSGSAQHAF